MITLQLSQEDARVLEAELEKHGLTLIEELADAAAGEPRRTAARRLEHVQALRDQVAVALGHETVEPEPAAAEQRPPADS